jgi:hypothetical protein
MYSYLLKSANIFLFKRQIFFGSIVILYDLCIIISVINNKNIEVLLIFPPIIWPEKLKDGNCEQPYNKVTTYAEKC